MSPCRPVVPLYEGNSNICKPIIPFRNKLLCQLFRALRCQWISVKMMFWHPLQLTKIKHFRAFLKLPAKQHCQFLPIQPIHLENGPNRLYWQCCLAGSSKRAPSIFIFSIFLGAEYLSYVKFIVTGAPTFFGYIISHLASVSQAKLLCYWFSNSQAGVIISPACLYHDFVGVHDHLFLIQNFCYFEF